MGRVARRPGSYTPAAVMASNTQGESPDAADRAVAVADETSSSNGVDESGTVEGADDASEPRSADADASVGEESATKALLTAERLKRAAWLVVRLALIPAAIYVVVFYIFRPYYLGEFSSHFWLDDFDGFQNVWNIWWLDKSLVELHTSPWYTQFLHWPAGVTLVPQTMSPVNGFMLVPINAIFGLSLVEQINLLVIFGFVMGGVTMFWLAYYLTRSWMGALVAGAIFTFSSYHFAHSIGHMQLITLEWIPLFVLLWIVMLDKMTFPRAVWAGLSLWLVLLSDYYYFFFAVTTAVIILLYRLIWRKLRLDWRKVAVFACFGVIAALVAVPLLFQLVHISRTDPLLGAHSPNELEMDLFTPFIPGGTSYWGSLTASYWTKLPINASETSIYIGWVTILLCAVAAIWGKRLKLWDKTLVWWIVAAAFFIMALGPRLRIFGEEIEWLRLPYAFAAKVFPPLQLGGTPVRMIVMVLFAAAIIVAFLLARVNWRCWWAWPIFGVLVVAAIVELYPIRGPLTSPEYPAYAQELEKLPEGAVIDKAAESNGRQLYNQTLYDKPQAGGYITRKPTSALYQEQQIEQALEQGDADRLCDEFKFQWLATRNGATLVNGSPVEVSAPIVWADAAGDFKILDLGRGRTCDPALSSGS